MQAVLLRSGSQKVIPNSDLKSQVEKVYAKLFFEGEMFEVIYSVHSVLAFEKMTIYGQTEFVG